MLLRYFLCVAFSLQRSCLHEKQRVLFSSCNFFGIRIFGQKIRFNCLPQLKSVLKFLLFVSDAVGVTDYVAANVRTIGKLGRILEAVVAQMRSHARDLPGITEECDG
jgi:hypothetical protein